jgi:hypothetical protein
MNKLLCILLFLLMIVLLFIIFNNIDFFDNTNNKYFEKYKITEYNNLNLTNNLNEAFLINKNYISNKPYFSNLEKINNIDSIESFILILDFPYWGGGTTFFLNSIISKYLYTQNFIIVRNFDNKVHIYLNDLYILNYEYDENSALKFLNKNKSKIIKIFLNSIIGHSKLFIENILLLNSDVTTITHDYSLLYNIYQPSNYNELFNNYTPISSNININLVKTIITQNINNIPLYDKYLDSEKEIIISPLPDYINKLNKIKTNNSRIVVGVLGNISTIKGRDIIFELINNNLYDVYIFGGLEINYDKQFHYKNIQELNELLIKYRPNIWLEASMWAETYSYTLSLMMITELPILYLKKNFISVIENRLSNYSKAIPFKNITHLIDYELIETYKQDYFYTIDLFIYYNEFWDNYFNSSKYIVKNKFDISTYIVYFPQFHEIEENNINFYNGFTDIKNLNLLLKVNNNFETPKLKNILDYDLIKNEKLMDNHIDIITKYNINGFAVYYYWFSTNTITNKNMIMENVINKFFSMDLNTKKVFFIWANENWSKNSAFGNSDNKIENEYTLENIQLNILNLLNYFNNINYLKIDNKPVFLLHHPWFLTNENLLLLYNELESTCINNGFNGIYFVVNSMRNYYTDYLNYNFHFNYKNSNVNNYFYIDNQKFLNYENYTNSVEYRPNEIQTMVFDFDNRARLFKPYKLNLATICANNTIENQIRFFQNIINSYKNSTNDISKILLVNAWNEWGEKMVVEPSNEKGEHYLFLLKSLLEK